MPPARHARAAAPLLTPTPQDVAEGIAREARLLLFEPRVLAMDAFPVAALPAEPAVVFVASTTGQARPGFPVPPPSP
jgi:hypothetical protein